MTVRSSEGLGRTRSARAARCETDSVVEPLDASLLAELATGAGFADQEPPGAVDSLGRRTKLELGLTPTSNIRGPWCLEVDANEDELPGARRTNLRCSSFLDCLRCSLAATLLAGHEATGPAARRLMRKYLAAGEASELSGGHAVRGL